MTGREGAYGERDAVTEDRRGLRLSGVLLFSGIVVNTVSTLIHPSGDEDDHQAIFAEYADSGSWEAVHIGQFIGGLLIAAAVIVLYRTARSGGGPVLLGRFAAGAAVATIGALAVLQGLDGIALKQSVDAWLNASPTDEASRFADAETVRWLEWGFQSYFRILLGLSFGLIGAALLATRLVASWVGWAAIVAGLSTATIGIDVGYSGLDSDFQGVLGMVFLAAVVIFALGVLLGGSRGGEAPLAAQSSA